MGSTTVQAPAPRNIAQEAGDTLQTQIDLAPQQLAAYQQTAPGYADVDRQNLFNSFTADNGILNLNNLLASQTAAANQAANSAQRVADVTDLNTYGGGMLRLQQSLNKDMYDSMADYGNRAYAGVDTTEYANRAGQIAANGFGQYTPTPVDAVAANNGITARGVDANMLQGQAVGANMIQGQNVGADAVYGRDVAANTGFDAVRSRQGDMGLRMGQMQLASGETAPGQLQRGLEQQAAQGLALGGQLSEQETRAAQQAARAAYAARGLGSTNASVAAEVLNLDSAQRARLAERQQLAASVDAQGNAQRNQNFSNTLDTAKHAGGYGCIGTGHAAKRLPCHCPTRFQPHIAHNADRITNAVLGISREVGQQHLGAVNRPGVCPGRLQRLYILGCYLGRGITAKPLQMGHNVGLRGFAVGLNVVSALVGFYAVGRH